VNDTWYSFSRCGSWYVRVCGSSVSKVGHRVLVIPFVRLASMLYQAPEMSRTDWWYDVAPVGQTIE